MGPPIPKGENERKFMLRALGGFQRTRERKRGRKITLGRLGSGPRLTTRKSTCKIRKSFLQCSLPYKPRKCGRGDTSEGVKRQEGTKGELKNRKQWPYGGREGEC